ncbi:MAG TPA: PmeII family type II restriction endonuclease [Pyrinomonadaceae bacterium]|nr:PmeII family type II restriction endonuclease [Pyrinomonadaceae bacterium]
MWITYLVRKFVWNAIEEIQATNFDELLINPFLIRAFNFMDHEGVVTFCFYQKVTRSIVTSWGFTVEQMLLVSGSSPITGEKAGFDLRVHRSGKEFHIQIKSSPNTMDYDQVRHLNSNIVKLQEFGDRIGVLGVTYGKDGQLSSIMQKVEGYPGSVLMGRRLWDFIADEKGYTEKVLEWAAVGMRENIHFSELLENKRAALIQNWEEKYGTGVDSIKVVLEQYL